MQASMEVFSVGGATELGDGVLEDEASHGELGEFSPWLKTVNSGVA